MHDVQGGTTRSCERKLGVNTPHPETVGLVGQRVAEELDVPQELEGAIPVNVRCSTDGLRKRGRGKRRHGPRTHEAGRRSLIRNHLSRRGVSNNWLSAFSCRPPICASYGLICAVFSAAHARATNRYRAYVNLDFVLRSRSRRRSNVRSPHREVGKI